MMRAMLLIAIYLRYHTYHQFLCPRPSTSVHVYPNNPTLHTALQSTINQHIDHARIIVHHIVPGKKYVLLTNNVRERAIK